MTVFSPSLDSLRTNSAPARLGILASGSGSNFEVIVEACRSGVIRGEVSVLVGNNPGSRVFERAERLGVDAVEVDHRNFDRRRDFDARVVEALHDNEVDWVVMAGWMRIATPVLIDAFEGRTINLHPSLLPAFPGYDAVGMALESGVRISGCTVHIVTLEVDGGPIVAQAAVPVLAGDDHRSLHERIHKAEHSLFARAIAHAIAVTDA